MFFYVIFLVLQFVSRKLFLDNLGDEFIGLSGTLRSFLSILNLAEFIKQSLVLCLCITLMVALAI